MARAGLRRTGPQPTTRAREAPSGSSSVRPSRSTVRSTPRISHFGAGYRAHPCPRARRWTVPRRRRHESASRPPADDRPTRGGMMPRLKYLLSFAVAVLLPAGAAAQNPANLTGLVTDEEGQPLANAAVFIDAMNLGSLTNDNGRYLLNVPASRFTAGQQAQVTAQLIGRTSQNRTVTLQAGTVNIDFQ